jgi:hypothetical protein
MEYSTNKKQRLACKTIFQKLLAMTIKPKLKLAKVTMNINSRNDVDRYKLNT